MPCGFVSRRSEKTVEMFSLGASVTGKVLDRNFGCAKFVFGSDIALHLSAAMAIVHRSEVSSFIFYI
jgi:hypothetical protein